jgi:hypothetical protein
MPTEGTSVDGPLTQAVPNIWCEEHETDISAGATSGDPPGLGTERDITGAYQSGHSVSNLGPLEHS